MEAEDQASDRKEKGEGKEGCAQQTLTLKLAFKVLRTSFFPGFKHVFSVFPVVSIYFLCFS